MEQNRKKTSKPYSPEFRERAVRLVAEHRDEYRSDAAAHAAIASKLGSLQSSNRPPFSLGNPSKFSLAKATWIVMVHYEH